MKQGHMPRAYFRDDFQVEGAGTDGQRTGIESGTRLARSCGCDYQDGNVVHEWLRNATA